MKRKAFAIGLMFAAGALAVTIVIAQPRPAAGSRQTARETKSVVMIKGMRGLRGSDRLRTPDYTTTISSKTSTRTWGCICVDYETSEDWIDDLEFRYFVMVVHPVTKVPQLFTKTITYIEIPKGKHTSDVFLRPNTIDRYGPMERAAVEIWLNGERVAFSSLPEAEQPWWQLALVGGKVKASSDILMNRAETPFALISYDQYETIKPAK